jgi:undecaprenyl-diphosphatase
MNLEWLYAADEKIFFFFNRTCHTPVLDNIMVLVTRAGDGMLLFVAGLFLMLLRGRRNKTAGLVLMATLTVTYHIGYLLKEAIARPRPFLSLPGVNALVVADGFSMPSNHASTAFAAAFILTEYYGRWYIFYPLAFLVAVSRIYVGVHFPGDVLAGALVGVLIGYILVKVACEAVPVRE